MSATSSLLLNDSKQSQWFGELGKRCALTRDPRVPMSIHKNRYKYDKQSGKYTALKQNSDYSIFHTIHAYLNSIMKERLFIVLHIITLNFFFYLEPCFCFCLLFLAYFFNIQWFFALWNLPAVTAHINL